MNELINKGIYGNRDAYDNVGIVIYMWQINKGSYQ
jgi:hypothetical protein